MGDKTIALVNNMKPQNHYKYWTPAEIETVQRFRLLGFSHKQIAKRVGRSVRSIDNCISLHPVGTKVCDPDPLEDIDTLQKQIKLLQERVEELQSEEQEPLFEAGDVFQDRHGQFSIIEDANGNYLMAGRTVATTADTPWAVLYGEPAKSYDEMVQYIKENNAEKIGYLSTTVVFTN